MTGFVVQGHIYLWWFASEKLSNVLNITIILMQGFQNFFIFSPKLVKANVWKLCNFMHKDQIMLL